MFRNKLRALHYYAFCGNYSKVQSLVSKGVDPDGKNAGGVTPLMLAAEGRHRDVFELLIKLGAHIDCYDVDGWTVLHHASCGGSFEIVQSLVNKGVAVDKMDFNGNRPVMVANSGEVVEVLINSGADIHRCDDVGGTLLHKVIREGFVKIVHCLVNKGVDIDKKNSHGITPLMLAAKESRIKVFELLINSGADIHCCDNYGRTLLHYASCGWSVEIVQCLVNKGIVLDKTFSGKTPLNLAAQLGRIEIAVYLLKAGADCNLEDNDGKSPLNSLIMQKRPNVEVIKLCIEKGAFVKSTDYYKLMKKTLLKKAILQDVKICSQAIINKFNNKDLDLLYKGLASAQKLPHIDLMKIRNSSAMALGVELAVTKEIQAKGFCNLFKMVPLALCILCVKSAIEKSIPAYKQANLSESCKGIKRLRSLNAQDYPCKKMGN